MKPQNYQSASTRWSLVERLRNWDDKTSWQEFFDSYWRLIYHTAIKAGLTEDEAREVVQETVIAVARSMQEFKADPKCGSFKGWLLQITRWRIADEFRKRPPAESMPRLRSRERTGTDTAHRVPDPAANVLDEIWEKEWQQNLFDTALEKVKRQVSSKQYQIFYLHVIKRQPARTVCAGLNVNAAQVYLAKHRVGSLVKQEVKRLEKDSA
jgi:RNA polymerase sigma-70 factor (ECF subfamily)